MTSLTWKKKIACCLTLVLLAGCHTFSNKMATGYSAPDVTPVVVGENEYVVRDQLIILVDVTGSIGSASQYRQEKDLVEAFTAAMPDGTYHAGIDSFAGVSTGDWVEQPLTGFDRGAMVDGAASIKPLGSTTPLARAIQAQKGEVAGIGGRGALLVFSDGEVKNPLEVLQACRDLEAVHGGEFCIYTVGIGTDRDGIQLLRDMAEVNGCGKYYDGAALNSADAYDAMAREIFLAMRDERPTVVPPSPETLPLSLRNILFDNDKSVVAASYDSQLESVVDVMARNPAMRLRLDGHTDFHASNAYNQKLSERRVNAVKAALIQRGADAPRLITNAYGEKRPTVPNDSPEHLHMNRRVELTVVN